MAGMTWGQLVTIVAYNLGKVVDGVIDPTVSTLLPFWAQSIITDMSTDRNYWFLRQQGDLKLKAQVQKYPLPPGFTEGMTLYLKFGTTNKAYVELRQLFTRQEVVRLFAPAVDLTDCAQPTHFLVNADSLEVWPCPEQDYLLGADFWGDMNPPTDGSMTSQFQNYLIQYFPTLFEYLLTQRGFAYTQESEDEDKWMKKAMIKLGDLHARHVARVMGSDFCMRPRTDVYGDVFTDRGNNWVTYFWGN